MKNIVMAALIVFGATSCATVKLTSEESAALKVLQHYLHLDRAGVRMQSNTTARDAELVTWTEEPGWDSVVIVSGWTISRPQLTGDRVITLVRYSVAGILNGTDFQTAEEADPELIAQNSQAEFVLVLSGDGWKIDSPQFAPHIGFPAARAFLESAGETKTVRDLVDAEYIEKLKGQRSGTCNCQRLDF